MSDITKTVLITGASSGIGKSTAMYFSKKGWNVIATMRSPEKEMELNRIQNIDCVHLDVTDSDSIKNAIETSLNKYKKIDVIVNNAGYGLTGPFELLTKDQIHKQFETNVFGLMEVTKQLLPHFRKEKMGTIVNISSVGGRLTFPLYSLYHGSKWAVEGFSESLQFELAPFNIKVKLVEPGPIQTDFYDRSADKPQVEDKGVYTTMINSTMNKINKAGLTGLPPEAVAKVIYKAANSKTNKLRYGVGLSIQIALFLRKILPDIIFLPIIRQTLG